MDPVTQFGELGPVLGAVVDRLGPDDLDRPTPCPEFTVRGVLEHMIGHAGLFAAIFRDEAPGVADTTDVLAAFGPAMSDLVAAIGSPGVLDRVVAAPFGDVPGEVLARIIVMDALVHGWDIATATSQLYEPPEQLVAEVDTFARGFIDALRDGQTFGPAVVPPEDATPIERLAAFTGRRPPRSE